MCINLMCILNCLVLLVHTNSLLFFQSILPVVPSWFGSAGERREKRTGVGEEQDCRQEIELTMCY